MTTKTPSKNALVATKGYSETLYPLHPAQRDSESFELPADFVYPEPVQVELVNDYRQLVWSDKTLGRVTDSTGQFWFKAADVCSILGYQNSSDAIANHCSKYTLKRKIRTNGGQQMILFISEPDLYRLITNSEKPQAKAFERWVYEVVLVSLRHNGKYNSRKLNPSPEGQAIIDAAKAKEKALYEQLDFFPTHFKMEFEKPVAAKLGEERARLSKEGIEFATEKDFLGYIVSKYFEEVA